MQAAGNLRLPPGLHLLRRPELDGETGTGEHQTQDKRQTDSATSAGDTAEEEGEEAMMMNDD